MNSSFEADLVMVCHLSEAGECFVLNKLKRRKKVTLHCLNDSHLLDFDGCGGLDVQCPHGLMYLKTCSLVGGSVRAVMESLVGANLLQEVHLWGGLCRSAVLPHFLLAFSASCMCVQLAISSRHAIPYRLIDLFLSLEP